MKDTRKSSSFLNSLAQKYFSLIELLVIVAISVVILIEFLVTQVSKNVTEEILDNIHWWDKGASCII